VVRGQLVGATRQQNGMLKKFEERRVLCAFASMGKCPLAMLWVRRSTECRLS
jgi:uncharacterized membrane protein (UPF0127 family)